MKHFVILDTNVLVSALLKKESVPAKILQCVSDGFLIPLLHYKILNEYENVLQRPKFRLTQEEINDVLGLLITVGIFLQPESSEIEFLDKSDKIFYELANEKQKDDFAYLVTGNLKHFPTAPFIVSPREMLIILEKILEDD